MASQVDSRNPQIDPRIVHMWNDAKLVTLCGLTAETLEGSEAMRANLPRGTAIFLCFYCNRASRHPRG